MLFLIFLLLIVIGSFNVGIAVQQNKLGSEIERLHYSMQLLLMKARRQVTMTDFTNKVAQIQQSVSDLTTVDQSAIALLDELTGLVNANKNDPAALDSILAGINAQRDSLAAAVAANTPADATGSGTVAPATGGTDTSGGAGTGTDTSGTGTGTDTSGGAGTGTDPTTGLDAAP